MKVHVSVLDLQKKLPFVSHAISSRSQLPILLHLLLETRDNKLFISATDLEIGIEVNVAATIEDPGGIAVPAKLFIDLINSLPTDNLILETGTNDLLVSTKKTRSSIQILSKDEFPVLYDELGSHITRINQDIFKKNLSRVVFSATTDTTRPSLSGVMMRKTDKGFDLVATDGYRLSYQKEVAGLHQEGTEALEKQLIIPSRVIRDALILKTDEETDIYLAKRNNQILFAQQETVLIGRLIEAEFPPFEKIIPASFSTKVYFDREELWKAVKACAIFARDAGNIIKFVFFQDKIIVSAHTPSVGDNTVEVEAKLEGEEKEIAFNAKYLLDLFSILDEDALSFEMTGPLNPGVFRIENDPTFLHLIMPIRTESL